MKPKQAAASNVDGGCVEAVVDLAHLDQYTLGDLSLQAELLQLFRMQLKNQTEELVSCGDATLWRSAVHTSRVRRGRSEPGRLQTWLKQWKWWSFPTQPRALRY